MIETHGVNFISGIYEKMDVSSANVLLHYTNFKKLKAGEERAKFIKPLFEQLSVFFEGKTFRGKVIRASIRSANIYVPIC